MEASRGTMDSHGALDLFSDRRTNVKQPGFADGLVPDDFDERRERVRRENVENPVLNEKSKKITDAIKSRLWATMYLQYLLDVRLPDLPDVQTLSLDDMKQSRASYYESPFAALPVDFQNRIVDRRLQDARIGLPAIWAALNQLVSQLTSEITTPPSAEFLAYRAYHRTSKAAFFPEEGDIRCGNWHNFDVNGDLTGDSAREHITGGAKEHTSYISVSTSPLRIWNFIKREDRDDLTIAVIDLRVLKRLGIAYGSTTIDLGFNSKTTDYATGSHFLVVGWIPKKAILGRLSKERFQVLLKKSQFDISRGRTRRFLGLFYSGDGLFFSVDVLSEYERKIPYQEVSKFFRVRG